jgi:acetolactate synthase-1/2/3 large subunit
MGTSGQAVLHTLERVGVDHAFTVPGESFLGLLDAMRDSEAVRVVPTRHEGAAAFMAEAYAKLTRRLTVCMATRTVGAANAAIGLHTALQDSSPVMALFGQVATNRRHREAFQESDLTRLMSEVTKWTVEPPSAERMAELVAEGAARALSGRPGPVAVALREDLLDVPLAEGAAPVTLPSVPLADEVAVQDIVELVRTATRPVMLLGVGVLAGEATDIAVALAEAEELPVMTAWRRPDAFPNDHRLYLGQTGLGSPACVRERLLEADVVLVVGSRLDEITTFDYSVPASSCRLVHVDVEPDGLHRGAVQAVIAESRSFLDAALQYAHTSPSPADARSARASRNAADRRRWEAATTPRSGCARAGFADQQIIARHLRDQLADSAIVTSDAGNFSGWAARYLRWRRPGTFLGPTSGAMGYAVPAAIAASMARPATPVGPCSPATAGS